MFQILFQLNERLFEENPPVSRGFPKKSATRKAIWWHEVKLKQYTACVIYVTTVCTRSSKTAAQSNWLHQTAQLTHVHKFVTGNSIVRTLPRNQAWGHCGETGSCKMTQRPLLYPCLNALDVLVWWTRLCNSFGEANPHKGTWLHRLINMPSSTTYAQSNQA